MQANLWFARLTATCAGLLMIPAAFAVSIGQIDTFESGTTENWQINLLGQGAPPPAVLPKNAPTGGPGGVDDAFLLLTSVGGDGPGSRLSVINLSQWGGNYILAGVGAIRMNVNNLGETELSLRILLSDPGAGPPNNVALSTDAIQVPPGSGWITVEFPVGPANLTAGLGSVETALMNATELRLYHSPAANFPNPVVPIPPVVALLGVDNIEARAAAVPDSGPTGALLSLAFLALVVAGRSVRSFRFGPLP